MITSVARIPFIYVYLIHRLVDENKYKNKIKNRKFQETKLHAILVFRRHHLLSTSGNICRSGSFAVKFGDHFRSGGSFAAGDHLRWKIICGGGSFAVGDHLRRSTARGVLKISGSLLVNGCR